MDPEALEGVTDMDYMFQTCSELRSIYVASGPTTVAKESMMLYGYAMLVGAERYVSKNTDDHSKLSYGGVLTDPDLRESTMRITIDESLALFEGGNMNYWFYSMGKIESVSGLDNLSGIGEMLHTFNSCKGLTELDFRGFGPVSLRRWSSRSARGAGPYGTRHELLSEGIASLFPPLSQRTSCHLFLTNMTTPLAMVKTPPPIFSPLSFASSR